MLTGFIKPSPDLRNPSGDLRRFFLLTPWVYIDIDGDVWIGPPGSFTDGLSRPNSVGSLIQQNGPLAPAAVGHDMGYHGTLLKATRSASDGPLDGLTVVNMNQQQLDTFLFEMLKVCGGSEIEDTTIYEILRLAGEPAFIGDLVLTIPHIDTKALLATVNQMISAAIQSQSAS